MQEKDFINIRDILSMPPSLRADLISHADAWGGLSNILYIVSNNIVELTDKSYLIIDKISEISEISDSGQDPYDISASLLNIDVQLSRLAMSLAQIVAMSGKEMRKLPAETSSNREIEGSDGREELLATISSLPRKINSLAIEVWTEIYVRDHCRRNSQAYFPYPHRIADTSMDFLMIIEEIIQDISKYSSIFTRLMLSSIKRDLDHIKRNRPYSKILDEG